MDLTTRLELLMIGILILLRPDLSLSLRKGTFLVSVPHLGRNKKCMLPVLAALPDTPTTECALRCGNEARCGGINVFRSSAGHESCELIDGKAAGTLVDASGYTFYENHYYDDCNSKPCLNGASCTDGINSYNCLCVLGYTGSHCETDIDDCVRNGCIHGSTCIDGINSYACRCLPGYSGQFCEKCPVMKMGSDCDQDCKMTSQGLEFNGTISTTKNGRTCQRWDSYSPHIHTYNKDDMFPDTTVADAANYCRNPVDPNYNTGSAPWCYTTSLTTRWEYCDVPLCT